MYSFNRHTAIQIAIVSILLAAVASPAAWFVAHLNAERSTVSLAVEESRRLLRLHHFDTDALSSPDASKLARKAANALAGGLFDIAEIYDKDGKKLAMAMTDAGHFVEAQLPAHIRPTKTIASFESLKLNDKRWVLRVFVPLKSGSDNDSTPIAGYFEGVRIISDWQHEQMFGSALTAALMVGSASLMCGAVVYPVVVRLNAENAQKTNEILSSHISMMAISTHPLEKVKVSRERDSYASEPSSPSSNT